MGAPAVVHNLNCKENYVDAGGMHMNEYNKITALYSRLSVGDEDRDGGESNSIVNQKAFLERYAQQQRLTNIRHYIDDDESGRFFDRSAYSRMMDDVENGKIGVCIMKDLTRWGRDYLQVGNAMEIFRRNNVRFIAVNNGIDSEKPDTLEFAPFINIMSEWYAKDISKKVKTGIRTKGASGKPIATEAPYGYMKDPNNKDFWIIDEEAAEAGSVPALRFTTEGTGYYTLPAGMTSLAWLFRGTHVEGKNVEMEDYIPNVKAGGKYTLTFKYSPDLPGFIDCVLISVDPDTDDKDDEIIFSPDPAVISEGFDITEIQKYRSGEKKYRIMAFSELTRFTVSVGDKSYDALNGTTEGISLEPVDKYNVRLTLSDAFFASCQAGDQKVTLRIEDANGGSSEVATTYRLEGLVPVTADDYDLWANTVTLRVVSFTPGTTVQFGLRSSGGEWQPMAGTSQGDDFITATYAPQWVPQTVKEQTVYTQAAGTGIIATHSYDFRAIINGTETTGTFTAGEVQPIPNGDMSGWSMTGGFAFPNAAGESFWSSGNNTMTKTLCTSTDVKFGKSAPAAKLTSTNMLVLAAGNLFTGEFAYKSFTGTVQFGQTYAFTARPSAMKVKYHAHVGTVDKVRTSGDICPYIKKGDPDMARIFVAIVDWNAPHEVVSGMTTTKGAWDPEKGIDNVSEGKILGYGSLWITQSTEGEDMQDAELDIVWYDHETRPAEGKYSLVISCACNAYGDYFTGCSKNVMYVDDFEWVY